MQPLDHDELRAVWGGDETTVGATSGPAQDETTGYCGPGRFSLGQTPECQAHDNCVGEWAQSVGRPAADAICLPLLGPAIKSAARCAVDPYCPK